MTAQELRLLRRQAGLCQQELGHAVGVSGSAVGMYEQGRRRPSEPVRHRLALYFELNEAESAWKGEPE